MAEKRLRCIVFCGLDSDTKIPYEEIGIYNGGIKYVRCMGGYIIFAGGGQNSTRSGENLGFGELVKSPLKKTLWRPGPDFFLK